MCENPRYLRTSTTRILLTGNAGGSFFAKVTLQPATYRVRATFLDANGAMVDALGVVADAQGFDTSATDVTTLDSTPRFSECLTFARYESRVFVVPPYQGAQVVLGWYGTLAKQGIFTIEELRGAQ